MRRGVARLSLGLFAVLALTGCFSSPPQIISLEPNRGSSSVVADQPITVVFDHDVDHASVAGRFHISPGLPGCDIQKAFSAASNAPCAVQWLTDRPGFVFVHPGAIFAPSTQYNLSLDGGVTDTGGVVNPLDHSWTITTEAAPVVAGTTPAGGTTHVPVDAPVAIEFDRPMDVASTSRAISLSPPVEGLTVVRNTIDNNRFVVLPGRYLAADTAYTVTVSTAARDNHGQPLAIPVTERFTTGGLSGTRHLAVLIADGAGAASRVDVVAAEPAQTGEPPLSATVLDVGSVPGTSLSMPALSPSGGFLAVVQSNGQGSLLRVIDVSTGYDAYDITGGSLPSWSQSGTLAYALGADVVVRHPDGSQIILPRGDALTAPPVWAPGGALLALPVASAAGAPHIDLATPSVQARYPLPGLGSQNASAPVFSADGAEMALHRDGTEVVSGIWVTGVGSGAAAQRVAAAGVPVGFADPSTLVVAVPPDGSNPALARLGLGGGGLVALAGGPGFDTAAATVVSADGRQIAYLAGGGDGGTQAWIENGNGSGATLLTNLPSGSRVVAVAFSA